MPLSSHNGGELVTGAALVSNDVVSQFPIQYRILHIQSLAKEGGFSECILDPNSEIGVFYVSTISESSSKLQGVSSSNCKRITSFGYQ
jgi:hypothetical protein